MRFFSNTTLENQVCRPKTGINLYPFGAPMPGRQFNSSSYRYSYMGKEKDDEVKGNGNSYDFGARIYDPRIGRWLSVDPLAKQAPGWSPYRAFFDNPNYWGDLDGKIEWPLAGTSAKNKRDLNSGESTANVVLRTSTYREIRNVGTSPHIGIDYRASIGTSFYSLGDGKVSDIGTTKSGIKYVTVEYEGGDKVRFLHISSVSSDIKVGGLVKEGQILGETGNTGKYKNKKGEYVNYPAHLHMDAVDADGNKIDPEGKNYGKLTNEEFFTTYDGDYTKIPSKNENQNTVPADVPKEVAPADATRVAMPNPPEIKDEEKQ
jgi:RHS repeat-associated protein